MAASTHPATSRNAGAAVPNVTAPTLSIVGGNHLAVLDLNRPVPARMQCGKKLEIRPRAGHLFVEPGTLDPAIGLARKRFVTPLREEAAA
jgi:putative phosphoribosyl transferase